MRYIGCKNNLLPYIDEVVRQAGCSGGVLCDLFAGTHSVAVHFKKRGFQILSNDLLFLAYVFGRALIQNNRQPTFERLGGPPWNHLNRLNGISDGFVFNAYCPGGDNAYGRQYFSNRNGQRIDAIRQEIEQWRKAGLLTEGEYYLLLLSLLEAASRVANIAGTYGAYLKDWDPRTRKPLTLEPITVIPSDKEHVVYREDANRLIEHIECDVLYLDPPYNTRQYITNYHVLETIARYDAPEVYGKTGLRPYSEDEKSAYCSKAACLTAFADLIRKAKARHIIVSYNSEGIMEAEEILDVLRAKGEVRQMIPIDYQRFKSHSNSTSNTKVREYLFHVRTG